MDSSTPERPNVFRALAASLASLALFTIIYFAILCLIARFLTFFSSGWSESSLDLLLALCREATPACFVLIFAAFMAYRTVIWFTPRFTDKQATTALSYVLSGAALLFIGVLLAVIDIHSALLVFPGIVIFASGVFFIRLGKKSR